MESIESKTALRDIAAEKIRELLFNGTYTQGMPLREVEIANRLEFSRVPVREAFRLLEHENLVEYLPNCGVRVKIYSEKDIREIYELRNMMDCYIVRHYFQNIDEDFIAELESYCEGMNTQETYSECNNAFHKKIISLSNSDAMISVCSQMENQVRLMMNDCSKNRELQTLSKYLHSEIVKAMKSKDLERCEYTIEAHHHIACETIISNLETSK